MQAIVSKVNSDLPNVQGKEQSDFPEELLPIRKSELDNNYNQRTVKVF